MKNLAARFSALKLKVGGNREKMSFEYTYGPTPEEVRNTTRPSAPVERILSELQFALELSEVNGGKWDDLIDRALTVLEEEMEAQATLTRSACDAAERILLPMASAAKEYEVIYAGHAHIDMNWMWGWQETVAATLATFRTMLHLMEEYPDFTFMQSQGSVYKIVEKYDPKMMDEIKARIREGRWEVTASAWVETDKNMPDTESLLHHITVTRDYLREVWGVDPDSVQVDFSPDTFGHSQFVPEIDRFENVKYYYHCRGLGETKTLYRYRAPSGSEVLAYKEPYWYNSGVNPDNGTGVIGLSRRCAGLKTALVVYGVGDHGGGPTRRDLDRVVEMAQWPVFPNLHFGTLHEFFRKAEAVWDKLDVVEHEVNPFATGCYTTQSRIKLGNRRSEVSLNDSTKICALANRVVGAEYPEKRFNEAWQNVLFTHFHDILTGSCVQESREYAMGLFADALSYTQTAQGNALRLIAESVDTLAYGLPEDICGTQAEGAGAGYGLESYGGVPNCERGAGKTRVYVVFNTASLAREDVVNVTMWDYVGDLRRLEVVDEDGKSLPFELADKVPQKYWDHRYVRLNVRVKVPAVGYTTFAVREKAAEHYPTFYFEDERIERPYGDIVLENAYLRAQFDASSGALISLIDKEKNAEQLAAPAQVCLVMAEKRTNSAWNIGRHLKCEPVADTVSVKPHLGSVTQSVEMTHTVMHSTVKTTVTLDGTAKALKYAFEIDWNEAANKQDRVPVLTYCVPVAGGADRVLRDVPAGCVTTPPTALDIPGQTFAAALGKDAAPVIFTDCKYGYRLDKNVLSCTLINSAGSPDPYPERGIHRIQLWLAPSDGDPVALKRLSETLMRPLLAMPSGRKKGTLPGRMSLLTFESASTIFSSLEKCEDDTLILRVYEMKGSEDTVTVTLPFKPEAASSTAGEVRTEGNKATFKVGPHRLAELRVR